MFARLFVAVCARTDSVPLPFFTMPPVPLMLPAKMVSPLCMTVSVAEPSRMSAADTPESEPIVSLMPFRSNVTVAFR